MNGKRRRVSWEGQEAEQEEGWERLGRSEPNDDAQQRLGSESDTRNQRGEEGLRSRRDMCEGGRAHRSVQFNAREGKGEVRKKARAGVYAIECARGSESQKELRRIKGWRWWSIVATVQGRVYAVSKGLGSRGRRRKGTVTWGGEQTRMQGVIQDWDNPPSVGITLETLSESEHIDQRAVPSEKYRPPTYESLGNVGAFGAVSASWETFRIFSRISIFSNSTNLFNLCTIQMIRRGMPKIRIS
jgi:hypothetical protein